MCKRILMISLLAWVPACSAGGGGNEKLDAAEDAVSNDPGPTLDGAEGVVDGASLDLVQHEVAEEAVEDVALPPVPWGPHNRG